MKLNEKESRLSIRFEGDIMNLIERLQNFLEESEGLKISKNQLIRLAIIQYGKTKNILL